MGYVRLQWEVGEMLGDSWAGQMVPAHGVGTCPGAFPALPLATGKSERRVNLNELGEKMSREPGLGVGVG